jgi:hypothetical protein
MEVNIAMASGERNASTAALKSHPSLSMRKEIRTKDGLEILTKKIVGYAENVTETFCI